MPHPPVNERAVAVQVLTDVTENAAYANLALRQHLGRYPDLEPRGRAFITELANETLRNLLLIDYILDSFSKTPTRQMKPYIRAVLRISVCQLRFLDRIPPSAAVNEAVRLTKARGFLALAGFVNGVLRSVAREPGKPALPLWEKDPAAYLQLIYSYPAWLTEMLINQLGLEGARSFCEDSQRTPAVTVVTNPLKTTTTHLAERLTSEGVTWEPGALHGECLRIRAATDLARLPSFREGLFFVMDEGALAAVKALAPIPGQYVLDLCAAPGGKTFAAACTMGDKGTVRAFDIHPHKLALISETAERLGVSCVSVELGDAMIHNSALTEAADAVLLDAPCSGLGILRKRPDIKYNRKPEDIKALAQTQRTMLATAAAYVKPGGILIYCTCTVTREENIDNIRWFTANKPFKTVTPPPYSGAGERFFVEDDCLQLLPGPEHDGFFIAKLQRTGE